MKKLYIGTIALAICSSSFAQNGVFNTSRLIQKANYNSVIEAETPLIEKGITLWEDDFSTPSNWTLTNTSVPALDWNINMGGETSIPANSNGPAGMTTLSNGYLLIDSDGISGNSDGNGTPTVVDATIATPIDLSATGGTGQAEMNVVLEFQHNFRWWQDIRQVNVSGDNGSTWTTFDISDANGNVTGAMAQNSGNPEVTSINISAVAGGQSQVLIQFHYDDQDFWGWYWAVDDVKIKRQDADDLVATTAYFGSQGLPYFSIPSSQVAPIDFYTVADNVGYTDQTGSMVTVDVNSGTFTGTSAGQLLLANSSDTLNVTTQYIPATGIETHTITYTVSSDNTDITSTDNIQTDSFEVQDYDGIYSRDRGIYDGQGGGEDGATPGDYAFEAGSLFDIYSTGQVFKLDVVIGSNTPPGTIIYGKIYEWDGSAWVYVDETVEYTTTQTDADNNVTVELQLFTYPTLNAGSTYLPVVGCYSEFYYGTSGESEDQTSFVMYPTVGGAGSQYYTNATPMVRFNFKPGGIDKNVENTIRLNQNIPNPANNTTAINYSVQSNTSVNLTITDMTGKVIKTVNEGNKAAGDYSITLDVSELAEGLYHYTLSNGEVSITKSMSVIK